jgi:hypothetical protein
MKVTVTYTEVQYYRAEKQVEMTKKEYEKYLNTGRVNKELENDLSDECGDANIIATEHFNTDVEIIKT